MYRRGIPGLLLASILAAGAPARAQSTSCADCPTTNGELSIRNDTGSTLHYRIRWGSHPWHDITLPTGHIETHTYPLDAQRRAPAPVIRVDADMNPGRTDFREKELDFGAVEHLGYPQPGQRGSPVRYSFFIGRDRILGLERQR